MYRACRALSPSRLGHFSTRSLNKDEPSSTSYKKKKPCVQAKVRVPRAPLPWEGNRRHCVKVCPEQPTDRKCEFCEKIRNMKYTWDVHEEDPCKAFNQPTIMQKTICEIRRWQRCMLETGDPEFCKNLPPLGRAHKVYPWQEMVKKQRIPGCARPMSPYIGPEQKPARTRLAPHPKPTKDEPPKCKDEKPEQKPNWEPTPSLHNKDCPSQGMRTNPKIVGDQKNIVETVK